MSIDCCTVSVKIPKAFEVDGMAWRLKRFCVDWHKTLETSSTPGHNSSCWVFPNQLLILAFLCPLIPSAVDDALFFHKKIKAIQTLKQKMKAMNIWFAKRGCDVVAGFPGVHTKRKDGEIHLTQTGFIERMVSTLHLINFDQTQVQIPVTDFAC